MSPHARTCVALCTHVCRPICTHRSSFSLSRSRSRTAPLAILALVLAPPSFLHSPVAVNKPISITDEMFIAKGILSPVRLAQWLARGAGPVATSGCDFGGFFRSRPSLDQRALGRRPTVSRATATSAVRDALRVV